MDKNKKKLAVLASHPIEYQGPFFKKIAEDEGIDLTVYYSWDFGVGVEQYDPGFGKKIKWDIPLLEGYNHKFLKNYAFEKTSSRFFGEVNPGIIPEIFKNKYDAILVLGWSSFTAWLAFLAALISGTPVLLRGENPLSQELGKSRIKIFFKKIIFGTLFRLVSGFLYIGEENKKFYEYYGAKKERLYFAPYAVDNERYFSEAERYKPRRRELKKEIGLPEDSVTVLFVGKFIEKKRPMDILRAYELVKDKNMALVFVGDGKLRAQMEKFVADRHLENVRFEGFRNQLEVGRYYALADMFILPSGFGETWGLVVNEAMCFGLPIIVSETVGSGPDLVKDGENGFVVPTGDVAALAASMGEFVEDGEKRAKFGAASSKTIRSYDYAADIDALKKALWSRQ